MENSGDFIQKMMELGIGLSMVQQMPAMMQGVMTPQATGAIPPQMPTGCYVALNGKQAGPFSDEELRFMIQNDILTGETLVWKKGMAQWQKASEVAEVNKFLVMNNIKKP